jgi:hypothetical protein
MVSAVVGRSKCPALDVGGLKLGLVTWNVD